VTDVPGRLLIVDDERPVLEVLSDFFTSLGYAVATASSGAEALVVARREPPHLVLLDVRMPGMDGVEVLRQLRALEPPPAVIMVTANEDADLAREMLQLGAFDYVAKPFDFGYLDRAVSAALLQVGAGRPEAGPAPEDAWTRLARVVFAHVRGMSALARASTGERLEELALDAAGKATDGRLAEVGTALRQMHLLLRIATEAGDLDAVARREIDAALADASQAAGG
jgi:two-component system response regulator (stage 0 sporulation protein F)